MRQPKLHLRSVLLITALTVACLGLMACQSAGTANRPGAKDDADKRTEAGEEIAEQGFEDGTLEGSGFEVVTSDEVPTHDGVEANAEEEAAEEDADKDEEGGGYGQ